jgi:DNA-binding MarR family transcriptional regulator
MREGKRPEDDLNFYALLGIVQAGMWLQDDLEKYLAEFGVSYGRFSLLLALLEGREGLGSPGKASGSAGAATGNDLSARLGINKATVAKMLDKLKSEGLAEASADDSDSRKKVLSVTAKGRALLERVIPGYLMRMRIIGSNLSDDEKRLMIRSLSKINFLDPRKALSRFSERPLAQKAEEIRELCERGSAEDVDRVMEHLTEGADLPTTKIVDRYLGSVKTMEGMKRIERYLFHGTQIQRNYCTLFFVRINAWTPVNKAYRLGLIDYVQAYSK